jgi:hypothetical protein
MEATIEFFNEYKSTSVMVHVFSVIVGMGAALVSDALFNTFIIDYKINKTENRVLGILSNIIWISLFFILLSGVAIFLSYPEKYMSSDKFLIKMFIVCCVVINGYLFQKFIHPALRKFNFTDTDSHHKYVKIRRLSFALGAVSFISWILAFILGSVDYVPFSFYEMIGIYFGVLFFGICASQLMERRISRNSLNS